MENPFTYAGAYGLADDGNGLWYDRARYVSQATGSFISMDPAGQLYDLNLYRFVGNNAVNHVDVSGENMEDIVNDFWKLREAAIKGEELPKTPHLDKYDVYNSGGRKGLNFDHLVQAEKIQKNGNTLGNGFKSAAGNTNSKMLSSRAAKTVAKTGMLVTLRVVGRVAVKRLIVVGLLTFVGAPLTGGAALAIGVPMAAATVADVNYELQKYNMSPFEAVTTSKTTI